MRRLSFDLRFVLTALALWPAILSATLGPIVCHLPLQGDATPALQQCIFNTPRGGTLYVPPGVYTLASLVIIDRPLSLGTQGLSSTEPKCGDGLLQASVPAPVRDVRCATFVASADFSIFRQASQTVAAVDLFRGGIIDVSSPGVTIDHIIVDGNHDARWPGVGAYCAGSYLDATNTLRNLDDTTQPLNRNLRPQFYYNVYVENGKSFTMTNSAIINAVCSSGLAISKGEMTKVDHNIFAYNGRHTQHNGYADGLTIQDDSRKVKITNNLFVGNTDSQLFVHTCRECYIGDNTLYAPSSSSSDNYTFAAHSGITLGAFAQSEGPLDYSGTVVDHNYVDCGPLSGSQYEWGCGGGIVVGQSAWGNPALVQNLIVQHNSVIRGAQVGLLVQHGEGITLLDNQVTPANGNGPGCASVVNGPISSGSVGQYIVDPGALTLPESIIRAVDLGYDLWASYRILGLQGIPNVAGQCGAPSLPAAPPPAPFSKPLPFAVGLETGTIQAAYEYGMGRMPASGEIAYWSSLTPLPYFEDVLDFGAGNIRAYLGSDGAYEPVITAAYQYGLGRAPGAGEIAYWKTLSPRPVYRDIIDNPDYVGNIRNYLSASPAAFQQVLDAAFQARLGRAPTPAEQTKWSAMNPRPVYQEIVSGL